MSASRRQRMSMTLPAPVWPSFRDVALIGIGGGAIGS